MKNHTLLCLTVSIFMFNAYGQNKKVVKVDEKQKKYISSKMVLRIIYNDN